MTTRFTRERGFTLIELMIVVAIIAVLAAVAYPSYLEQINKGKRAEAKSIVLQGTQWLERFYAENFRYDKNTADVAVTDPSQFGRFAQSPATGGANYTIAVAAAQATYTITATRAGSMLNDKCGDLRITNLGLKTAINFNSGKYANSDAAVAACWR
jgi:type IV pilus assembly protein PilE